MDSGDIVLSVYQGGGGAHMTGMKERAEVNTDLGGVVVAWDLEESLSL